MTPVNEGKLIADCLRKHLPALQTELGASPSFEGDSMEVISCFVDFVRDGLEDLFERRSAFELYFRDSAQKTPAEIWQVLLDGELSAADGVLQALGESFVSTVFSLDGSDALIKAFVLFAQDLAGAVVSSKIAFASTPVVSHACFGAVELDN